MANRHRCSTAVVAVLAGSGLGSCGEDGGGGSAETSASASGGTATGSDTTATTAPGPADGSEGGSTTTGTPPATDSDSGSSTTAAGGRDSSGTTDDTGDGVVTFDEVHPVFADRCAPCHTGASLGGHRIGAADLDLAYESSQQPATACAGLTVGACTIVRIQAGEMPMKGGCSGDPRADAGTPACLTQAEHDLVQAWIDGGELPPI